MISKIIIFFTIIGLVGCAEPVIKYEVQEVYIPVKVTRPLSVENALNVDVNVDNTHTNTEYLNSLVKILNELQVKYLILREYILKITDKELHNGTKN